MLKAVRFDDIKHEELLKYICEYKDKNNKKNESEAIRYLMQLGLDKINENSTTKKEKPIKDIDSLKQEIISEIMSQIGINSLINNVNVQSNDIQRDKQQFYTNENLYKNKVDNEIPVKQVTIKTNKDTSPLLANLIANSQR